MTSTPRERLAKREEAIAMIVEEALTDYRCHHSKYPDDGGGMALVDVLSRGPTIEQGQEEIREMAGLVAEVLVSHGWIESGQAGEQKPDSGGGRMASPADSAVPSSSPAPSLEAREVEVCRSCQSVAHHKCGKCGKEWFNHDASMAHTNQRFAPQLRAARRALEGIASAAPQPSADALQELAQTAMDQQKHMVDSGTFDPAPVEAREPLSDERVEEIVDSQAFREGFFRAAYNFESAQDEYVARCALVRAVASALRGEG